MVLLKYKLKHREVDQMIDILCIMGGFLLGFLATIMLLTRRLGNFGICFRGSNTQTNTCDDISE